MKRKKTKFLRLGYTQYSKLGLRRKNKQKYRRAKGGENKLRLKMKGHLRNVSIGFRNEKKTRGLIKGLKGVLIHNLEELKKLGNPKNSSNFGAQKTSGFLGQEIAIVAHVGNKKKKEIAEYALKNNIKLSNINPKKYIQKIEEKLKEAKEEKTKREEKKKINEKKAKEASEKRQSSDLKKSEPANQKEGNKQSSSADELATTKTETEKIEDTIKHESNTKTNTEETKQ